MPDVHPQLERRVDAGGGRVLRVVEAGVPDGVPVLMHHGQPGAGTLYGPHVEDAIAKGIRLIGYDRPGYGGSTRHAGYAVADTAADVRAIANALGLKRMAVWGFSGGGPHALACAALLPDVVVAAATLASPAPYGPPDLDYFAGMGQANVDDIKLMLGDEAAARAKLPADREATLALTPESLAEGMKSLMSEAELAHHSAEFAAWIVSSMHAGIARDADGWWDDGIAQLRPWGFDVESIRIPMQLWHGGQDRFVPVQHGRWLAAHIRGVDAHIVPEYGHGTAVQLRVPEVHAWLLSRM